MRVVRTIFGGCIVNEDLPESVLSANEECVDDFYTSDGEVTNAQYNKFLLSMGKSDEAITENAQNPVVNVIAGKKRRLILLNGCQKNIKSTICCQRPFTGSMQLMLMLLALRRISVAKQMFIIATINQSL
ncbi:hypothetical protein CVFO_1343 [Isorropodon fossajaponicum endosymbiont JTNG4]|uniref:hypothetical protein n=1 Tax=Isorropodon fossajaponicum symbiont TaxID=883811 RepID=UPI001936E2C0|nr:hypothetical protein [Isorropodon fossajaponicum symbiont]BBB24413.1 hypothetical protein CVFO_1343 [Isorropodon fossajaponicum endosymbiont JTNG4]